MKKTHTFTLEALLYTLAELDDPLPKELQQELQQIGILLGQNINAAILQIQKLVKQPQYAAYFKSYPQARKDIQSLYTRRPRIACCFPQDDKNNLSGDEEQITNLIQSRDAKIITQEVLQGDSVGFTKLLKKAYEKALEKGKTFDAETSKENNLEFLEKYRGYFWIKGLYDQYKDK